MQIEQVEQVKGTSARLTCNNENISSIDDRAIPKRVLCKKKNQE